MNLLIVRADGGELRCRASFGEIPELLGANALDSVNLGSEGRVMFVDSAAWETRCESGPGTYAGVPCNLVRIVPVRPLKPINPLATALYERMCKPDVPREIAGDVAIVLDEDESLEAL